MAISAVFTSVSGLDAATSFLDVVSNNVANANTTGFKTARVTFQDLLYLFESGGVGAAGQGVTPPGASQTGTGVAVDAITGLFTQGPLNMSGGQLDVAIQGEGFFSVTLPDGTIGYTRAGNFSLDSTGRFVSSDGFRLVTDAVVPSGASNVSIGTTGAISALVNGTVTQLGTLNLTRFTNPGGLLRVGNTTFVASAATGNPVTAAPGVGGNGTLQQGFLEGSNVEVVTELTNLIIAQQSFAFNARAITVENQVLQATTDLIR
jgi:flagellar basal-body rod protein FlgG